MYCQFFLSNLRGEPILYRDYRPSLGKETIETFYREVIANKDGTAPPCMCKEGVNYYSLRSNSLFFVLTAIDGPITPAPSFTIELLSRLAATFRDYCGVLSEECVRRNIVLCYEILYDFIDWGYPQATNSEMLRPLVHTPAAEIPSAVLDALNEQATGTKASRTDKTLNAAERAVTNVLEKLGANPSSYLSASSAVRPSAEGAGADGGQRREELFVDLAERLSVLFSASGDVVACEVTGSLTVKNCLSGQPDIHIFLNDDFIVGRNSGGGNAAIVIEDCNFHNCVNSERFGTEKVLVASAPRGETVLMNYRAAQIESLPFRVYPFVDEVSPTKMVATVKVHADIPPENYGLNVAVTVNVPRSCVSCFCESTAGTTEYHSTEHQVVCTLTRVQGGSDFAIRISMTQDHPRPQAKREVGPVDISFEIPSWTATNVTIRGVSVTERGHVLKTFRWIRSLTQSNSYVRRLV